MLPKVGQTLYIQVESAEGEDKVFRSRICDVSESDYSIEIPLEENTGTYKWLHVGERIYAHYKTKDGVKNYFETTVTGLKEDVIQMIAIKKPHPNTITKVQRRQFLRVPANLEIAINLAGVRFLAVTDDVSGGGVSFTCERKFRLAEKMDLSGWLLVPFRDGKIAHVPFEGEVVRVKEEASGEKQVVMLKFQHIRPSDQDTIVRYCIERQLELRK